MILHDDDALLARRGRLRLRASSPVGVPLVDLPLEVGVGRLLALGVDLGLRIRIAPGEVPVDEAQYRAGAGTDDAERRAEHEAHMRVACSMDFVEVRGRVRFYFRRGARATSRAWGSSRVDWRCSSRFRARCRSTSHRWGSGPRDG